MVSWWRQIRNRTGWFYWTAAGKGANDAIRGHPTAERVREVETTRGDLDHLTRLLLDLMGKPALRAGDEPGGVVSNRRVEKDDFSEARGALRAVLERRNVKVDVISSEVLAGVLTDLAAVLRRSHELRDEDPDGPGPARLSFFESEMIQLAELEIDRICERWHKTKNALEARLSRIQHRLEILLVDFKTRDERHRVKQRRELHRLIPPTIYAAILITVGLTEYPLNMVAFEVLNAAPVKLLGAEIPVSMIIAIVPSIVIPLLAHVLGMSFRQGGFGAKKTESFWTEALVGVVSFLTVIACMIAVAFLRAEFEAQQAARDAAMIAGTPMPAIATGINWLDALALLAINGGCFVAGFAASYFSHDPDRELEQIWKHQERCWKKIERKLDEWGRLASDYDEARGRAITRILWIRHATIAKIDEYRDSNSRTPSPHIRPASFQDCVSHGFFRPRHFGGEIDPPPLPHNLFMERMKEPQRHEEGAS